MLKKVLWIAAACAAVLLALAVSRTLKFTGGDPPAKPVEEGAPAAVEAAAPAAATVPVAPPVQEAAPPPALTPDEQQVQEDAAATGMTTVEPEQPAPEDPPT